MALHPADFARKGAVLLAEIRQKFHEHGENKAQLASLINVYDPQVNKLYSARKEWTRRDYVLKNIEAIIFGSILALAFCLFVFVILDFLEIETFSLQVIVEIYLATAVMGGALFGYFRGPRDLNEFEKENKLVWELYCSGKNLVQHYNNLKMRYELTQSRIEKMEKIVQKQENIQRHKQEEAHKKKEAEKTQNIPARHIERMAAKASNNAFEKPSKKTTDGKPTGFAAGPGPSDRSPAKGGKDEKKKKLTIFGFSFEEREDRRNMLSFRFLSKIAKLKDKSKAEEVEVDTRPKILVIDSDSQILDTFEAALGQLYQVFKASQVEHGLEIAYNEKPVAIITEVEFPESKPFAVIKELQMTDPEHTIPIIVNSKNGHIDNFNEARSLFVVDYWIKHYNEDNVLEMDGEKIVERINFILTHNIDTLQRLFDRKIINKEIEHRRLVATEAERKPKIMLASKDLKLIAFLTQEFTTRNLTLIIVNNVQGIFGKIISLKPKLVFLDENLAEEHVFNICKMLNLRTRFANIGLILTKKIKLEENQKSRDLKIWKQYNRPFDQFELLRDILDFLNSKPEKEVQNMS